MIAKGYFIIFLLVGLFGMYYQSISEGVNLSYAAQSLVILALILGLYEQTFRKKVFETRIWKILFWLILLNFVVNLGKSFVEGSIYTGVGIQELLIGLLVIFVWLSPAYYAIYLSAFYPQTLAKKSAKKKK